MKLQITTILGLSVAHAQCGNCGCCLMAGRPKKSGRTSTVLELHYLRVLELVLY